MSSSNSFFLSPAANFAIKLQKSGRSYTEIYADYVKVNEELVAQKEETGRLESALAQILTDIEERVG
jgi:nucleoprotein TPR